MVSDPIRWRTPFGRFVKSRSVERLARDLSQRGMPMTTHTIYDWVAGRHAPRPVCAAAIVELAGGRISFEDIYRHRMEIERLSTGGSVATR